MNLGSFSVSLAVKDLAKSLSFYQSFGFEIIGGDEEHYVIIRNGECTLGLFHGMFEQNILTFNPDDVRGIQAHLKSQGIEFDREAEGESGAAHAMLFDPDKNVILIDQF